MTPRPEFGDPWLEHPKIPWKHIRRFLNKKKSNGEQTFLKAASQCCPFPIMWNHRRGQGIFYDSLRSDKAVNKPNSPGDWCSMWTICSRLWPRISTTPSGSMVYVQGIFSRHQDEKYSFKVKFEMPFSKLELVSFHILEKKKITMVGFEH